jgi:hypothetical protein
VTSLRGEERTEFPQSVRKAAFRRCCQQAPEGVVNIPGVPQCETCGKELRSGNFIYEHDQADGLGGEPTAENCKVHCLGCKVGKDKVDNKIMSTADRKLKAAFGLKPAKRSKLKTRGFGKAPPQRRASAPIEKWKGY